MFVKACQKFRLAGDTSQTHPGAASGSMNFKSTVFGCGIKLVAHVWNNSLAFVSGPYSDSGEISLGRGVDVFEAVIDVAVIIQGCPH
jgi:hypothetical protein